MYTLLRQLVIAIGLPLIAAVLVGYLPVREEAKAVVPLEIPHLQPLTKPGKAIRAKAVKPKAKKHLTRPRRFELSSECRLDDPDCYLTLKEPYHAQYPL
jgi:hypothetical protein